MKIVLVLLENNGICTGSNYLERCVAAKWPGRGVTVSQKGRAVLFSYDDTIAERRTPPGREKHARAPLGLEFTPKNSLCLRGHTPFPIGLC